MIPIKKEYILYFWVCDLSLTFTFVTLFPNLIEPYFHDSILKRAIESKFISYEFYNPRDFTTNKHKKVDDQIKADM